MKIYLFIILSQVISLLKRSKDMPDFLLEDEVNGIVAGVDEVPLKSVVFIIKRIR